MTERGRNKFQQISQICSESLFTCTHVSLNFSLLWLIFKTLMTWHPQTEKCKFVFMHQEEISWLSFLLWDILVITLKARWKWNLPSLILEIYIYVWAMQKKGLQHNLQGQPSLQQRKRNMVLCLQRWFSSILLRLVTIALIKAVSIERILVMVQAHPCAEHNGFLHCLPVGKQKTVFCFLKIFPWRGAEFPLLSPKW